MTEQLCKIFDILLVLCICYLYLNSDNDDFLYKGSISYITKNTVVVVDQSSSSILFFSKDGTPKSRFNHFGQGPREYGRLPVVVYDETADELFVPNNKNGILVYSSLGEYKRTIKQPQDMRINYMIDFDDRSLLFYDYNNNSKRLEALMAKTDLPQEDNVLSFYRISNFP